MHLTRARFAVIGALVLIGAVPAAGHHSFGAHYFEDQSISVEGDIVEFEYVNPHAWIHIQAADLSGRAQRVSAEWANPARLKQQGVTRGTLNAGDRVVITGSPSRNESEYKMHLKAIERRADGWKWERAGPAVGFAGSVPGTCSECATALPQSAADFVEVRWASLKAREFRHGWA